MEQEITIQLLEQLKAEGFNLLCSDQEMNSENYRLVPKTIEMGSNLEEYDGKDVFIIDELLKGNGPNDLQDYKIVL